MRRNVSVEPVPGSRERDSGNLGKLVGFLEAFAGIRLQRVNRVPIDSQIGPHSLLQHLVSFTLHSFFRLHKGC
jgi:hypothetical protein